MRVRWGDDDLFVPTVKEKSVNITESKPGTTFTFQPKKRKER